MQVIGFFQQLFRSLPGVVNFTITPLKDLNANLSVLGVIGDMSIIQMFSVGIVGVLIVFMVIHVVKLFV